MRTLFIMQGVPGSGKSTMAALIAEQRQPDKGERLPAILSTDDFWYHISPDGRYAWDRDRLSEAHRWNQQRTILEMQAGTDTIIIDNTNIERWQAQPYIMLARIFEYDVQVVSVQVDVETAVRRQKDRLDDRAVPEEKIREMHSKMEVLL